MHHPSCIMHRFIPGKVAPLGDYDASQRSPGMRTAGLTTTQKARRASTVVPPLASSCYYPSSSRKRESAPRFIRPHHHVGADSESHVGFKCFFSQEAGYVHRKKTHNLGCGASRRQRSFGLREGSVNSLNPGVEARRGASFTKAELTRDAGRVSYSDGKSCES